jgi:hypothetical protein
MDSQLPNTKNTIHLQKKRNNFNSINDFISSKSFQKPIPSQSVSVKIENSLSSTRLQSMSHVEYKSSNYSNNIIPVLPFSLRKMGK